MRGRTQGLVLCIAGAVAIGTAAGTYGSRGYHRPADAGAGLSAVVTSSASAVPSASTRRPRPAQRALPPLSLVLPALDVTAPVVPVRVRAGALDVPADPRTLGWWSGGARPGSAHGSVVIVGHVDDWKAGRGALYRLEAAPMGSAVSIRTAAGRVTYRVVGRRVYDKHALPTEVFSTRGAPRLVLITCGGRFDRRTHHYTDNVVVYATPA